MLSCSPSFHFMCVTTAKVTNLTDTVKMLNAAINRPGGAQFLNLTHNLAYEIILVNNTRVSPPTLRLYFRVSNLRANSLRIEQAQPPYVCWSLHCLHVFTEGSQRQGQISFATRQVLLLLPQRILQCKSG